MTTLSLLVAGVLWLSPAAAQQIIALRGAAIETATAAGRIPAGTILLRDGVIEEVGAEVAIPITAHEIDLRGKWIMPGVVDPYFVVSVATTSVATEEREVTFGGRTFRIPGSPAAVPTEFSRIATAFDPRSGSWEIPLRSGITSAHWVSSGQGQGAVAQLHLGDQGTWVKKPDGFLFLALTNQTASLEVLRRGLNPPQQRGGSGGEGSTTASENGARMRGGRGGRPSSGDVPPPTPTPAPNAPPPPPPSPQEALWQNVREGKQPLFVNANNSAAILYLAQEMKKSQETEKGARIVLVAGGENLYRTIDALIPQRTTIVMPPRLDLIPNSRDRVNVARMLAEAKIPVAFSLSLNQDDYRRSQESPLFAVSMLVRAGFPRDLAMTALSRLPAELLGIDQQVGSIAKGKRGNFLVFDEDPLSATANLLQVIVDGRTVYDR